MDFIKNLISKIDLKRHHTTHVGAFVLGIFLTFGVVAVDGQFNTSEYRKSGAASVLKSTDELKAINAQKRSERATTTEDAVVDGLVIDDTEEVKIKETVEEELEAVEVVEPTTQVVEETSGSSGGSSEEAVKEALEAAQDLLADLSQTQAEQNESADENVVFVTPNGVKIDANGNVINENGSSEEAVAVTNTNTNTVQLPEGVYTLPNGNLVYADGTPYNGPVSSGTTYVQPNVEAGYITSPSGAVFNAQGQLISLPPKEKVELIPPTIVSVDNPPEEGSTIYISFEVKTWSYNNEQIDCSVNFYGNNIELCELYRISRYDYDWIGVDTEG